jgi:hypothetical protein
LISSLMVVTVYSAEEHCIAPYYYHDQYWKGLRKTHWTSGR